jgi:Chaperone of endosialidase
MKNQLKKLLFTLCIIALYNPLKSQNWQLIGNTPLSTQFFGTTDATDIRFRTSNVQQMVLRSTGNLGIGIGTPSARLHITRNGINGTPGSLFRADGLNTEVNTWQLFTGFPISSVTEKFRLYSEATTSPWIGLQSLTNGFKFQTAGAFERMRINGVSTGNTFNGFTGINATGFIGVSPNASSWGTEGPRTAIHIMDEPGGATAFGYRNYMKTGITYGTNLDFMYTGLRAITSDVTEALLAFGDNPNVGTNIGPDQMVVRCINGTGAASTGTGSLDGLEIMRFSGAFDGRVGVGDEFDYISEDLQPQRRMHIHDPGTNNVDDAQLRISQALSTANPIATDFRVTPQGNLYINSYGAQQNVGIEEPAPQERLDVAGNGRFQLIPNTAANCVIFGETVTTGVPADNRLKRLDFNNNPNSYLSGSGTWQSLNCTWNLGGVGNVFMGTDGSCQTGKCGIGSQTPSAKLTVFAVPTATGEGGIFVKSTANNSFLNYGLNTDALGGTGGIVGVNGSARAILGVDGVANTPMIGIRGFANPVNQCGYNAIGVYGQASDALSCNSDVAGYFAGAIVTNQPPIILSDETVKTNIIEQTEVTDNIMNLKPMIYDFKTETYPNMGLASGIHHGFLAQDIAEVFPNLVEDVRYPGHIDSTGVFSGDGMDLKGVNYIELIPILVKGFQEQTKRIQNLEEQLAACCTAGMQMQGGNDGSEMEKSTNITLSNKNSIVLNQNVPNPFAEKTTISYNLPETVLKAQIMFYDQKGALINSQEIETRGAGQFNVFADDLSNGSYSYALVVDGKIIDTKTMVKSK